MQKIKGVKMCSRNECCKKCAEMTSQIKILKIAFSHNIIKLLSLSSSKNIEKALLKNITSQKTKDKK